MLHGIDYLRGKGVTSIELDGVFPAVPLYRKLGFRDKYLSLRFGRDPDNNIKPGNIQPSISINDIIKFDKRKTGLDRSRLLRGLYEQIPDSAFIDKNDNSFGYAIIKPCAGNYSLIGPMVCDNLKNAENLVTAIIQKYGNRILTIGVPEKNKDFSDLLIKNGFIYNLPSLRMYLDEMVEYEDFIYAILSAGQG